MNEPSELSILCEDSIRVHVGEEEVEVFPPTLAKLNATVPLWTALIKHGGERFGKLSESPKKGKDKSVELDIGAVLKDIYGFIDDLLPIVKVYLAPRGKIDSKFTVDQLREGLDISDMKKILKFVQVGDLLKNVLSPETPQKEAPGALG